jgi:hypothetical protein
VFGYFLLVQFVLGIFVVGVLIPDESVKLVFPAQFERERIGLRFAAQLQFDRLGADDFAG